MHKRQLLPLGSLQGFEAAARHLSITKAADELHLTQSAVSRQVGLLQRHLKVALFVRLQGGSPRDASHSR
jgi:LysR family transcriptional regulator, glycine cleavage system transcriptional activator